MNKNNRIFKLLFIFVIFFVFDNVYAGNETNPWICDRGKFFEIQGNMSSRILYSRAESGGFGLDSSDTTTIRNYNDGTVNFNYKYTGYGNCYNAKVSNIPTYEGRDCNAKYFNQSDLVDQTFDYKTGKISVSVALTDELASQINRLSLDINYDGSYGAITKDAANNRIIISGITPSVDKSNILKVAILMGDLRESDFAANSINAIAYCSNSNGKMLIDTLEENIYSADSFALENIENEFMDTPNCREVYNFSPASEEFRRSYVSECYDNPLPKMVYSEYVKIGKTISDKLAFLKELFKEPDPSELIDQTDLKCTNSDLGLKIVNIDGVDEVTGKPLNAGEGKAFESKTTLEYYSGNWAVLCREEYYVQADQPQLVQSGGGVHYDNRVEIDRTCTVASTNVAHKPPRCECITSYANTAHTLGGGAILSRKNGGPNSNFDSCIKKCDNGEYTQECINACYESTYNDNNNALNNILKSSKNDNFNKYVATKITGDIFDQATDGMKMADIETVLNMNDSEKEIFESLFTELSDTADNKSLTLTVGEWQSVTMDSGNQYLVYTSPPATHVTLHDYYDGQRWYDTYDSGNNAISITYAYDVQSNTITEVAYTDDACNQDTQIYVSEECGPPGCGDNSAYDNAVAASRNEYNQIKEYLKSDEFLPPIKNYTIAFMDADTGKKYEISGSTLETIPGVSLKIERDSNPNLTGLYDTITGHEQIGDDAWVDDITTFKSRVVYNISLPKQYTLAGDANTIYVESNTEEGVFYKKVADRDGTYHFVRTPLDVNLLKNGRNVYYTELSADDINIDFKCEPISEEEDSTQQFSRTVTQIKNGIPVDTTRTKLINKWTEEVNEKYFSKYSYAAYASYIVNGNFKLKTLDEQYDNIEVSFQIGTTGDVYKVGTKTDFKNSGFKCYYGVYNMLEKNRNDECETPPPPDGPQCTLENGKYYNKAGKKVSYEEYLSDCFYICTEVNGVYYNKSRQKVSYEEYVADCKEDYRCVEHDGKYYNKDGAIVTYDEYLKDCERKYYCKEVDGRFYDSNGRIVSKSTYESDCLGTYYCTEVNGIYYNQRGARVTKEEYEADCSRPTPTPEIKKTGLRYYYHEINLENIFGNRKPRWNWTGTINGNEVTGAAVNANGYIVDPERLIADIESKGNSIYTDSSVQAQEIDYEYTLTNATIQEIREYNKKRENGKKIPYTKFTLAVADTEGRENFSEKVAEWLGENMRAREISLSPCNNSRGGSCYNYDLGGR